jgi:hypothetical protein
VHELIPINLAYLRRYHVQEKLVNFMVPVHQEPPAFAGQLVANLFGFDQ